MTSVAGTPEPRARASDPTERIRRIAERRLTLEEVNAALSVPISDAERADVLALRAWFTRRYPTPADRLAYVRRAYQRWTAGPVRSPRGAVE
jgi:hypothetical protein